ncbi:hypothetical protein F8G81_20840 [Arthrobacter sp. CDRTa11]|uniref:hypothetical protein n=1 Tax=Arthrobacter sp. CDRTa11 TaxID=2651199 RepID=UPI0022658DA6|nr:hypothetical protein [Arthrobacter sp. CDRTa11]UZX04767.1 hypothetical protein F8G81_20840 [Arthrobacter sp. CDRTa11]
MTETAAAGQKEQTKAWNKRCNKIGLKYFVIALPPIVLLMVTFMTTLQYLLDVTGPLVSGELASGQPGFNEYQAAKDQALIILAVLLAFITAVFYFAHRWWKKSMRAIGPRPGGYPAKSKRWLGAA